MKNIVLVAAVCSILLAPVPLLAEAVRQSAREIPVAAEVDVVVVGGSLGAVAAALEAAERGASTLLVAPRTYLGDDLCATLRLWLEEGETPSGKLARKIFADRRVATPMRVKKVLEGAMVASKADFLLGCFATDVVVDASGTPAGIVLANRAGRQAILAKRIIDATERAVVAKMAGAEHRPWKPGTYACRRVVLGGEASEEVLPERRIPAGVKLSGEELVYQEFLLELDLGDGRFPAIAEAEQRARDLTYCQGQQRAAERITFVPSDRIVGRKTAEAWQSDSGLIVGHSGLIVEHFQPKGVDRIYVLGPSADLPPSIAKQFRRPHVSEAMGRVIGRDAALEVQNEPRPQQVAVRGSSVETTHAGDVFERLIGLRPTDRAERTVPAPEQSVPVAAKVDVLVVGGGTSGACVAIGAARRGAKVLVVEYQEGLGGVGTVGLIGKAYHGRNVGFTREVPFCDDQHNNEFKMQWFRREIRAAGGSIWLGSLGCGAVMEGDRVRGAVVATPSGRSVVLAGVVVDATGNGDVAVAAGAESMYGAGATEIALQGTGLPTRPLGKFYVNSDYLLVDETDLIDTWRALVGTRLGTTSRAFDMGTFIQTRERHRVVGDHILSYLDQIAGRTYPDSIVLSGSDYDSHGYPSEPFFALIPHTPKTLKANHPAPGGTCFTPYRCLLPRGLEGLLVTGLAISMHRDASAMVRMQKDMHNQGYAAGVAAAMAVEARSTPRKIDVDALKRHLVEIGNLPEEVLEHGDSFPLSQKRVARAVDRITKAGQSREAVCRALAIVFSHPEPARVELRKAFGASTGADRLAYAKILGTLGDREVVPLLIDSLDRITAWDAKILQGGAAEYAHLPTPIDAVILALGSPADRRATAAILKKVDMLDADVTLSHHRSVALALERIGDPAAARPLAELLRKPGMGGHAMTDLEPLYNGQREKRRRTGPLREIVLARALYRCGDHEGLGENTLREYQHDLRGLFARHATAVLAEKGTRAVE